MGVILVMVYLGGFLRNLPSSKELGLMDPFKCEILVVTRALLWPVGNLIMFGLFLHAMGKALFWMLFDRDRLFKEFWLDEDEKKT